MITALGAMKASGAMTGRFPSNSKIEVGQAASEQLAQLHELIAQSQQLENGIGLRFLYNEERRIFAIGYQVAERRLDTSFYDLLASEARLTSFLAIARGEVSVEHWWALSRPFGGARLATTSGILS